MKVDYLILKKKSMILQVSPETVQSQTAPILETAISENNESESGEKDSSEQCKDKTEPPTNTAEVEVLSYTVSLKVDDLLKHFIHDFYQN